MAMLLRASPSGHMTYGTASHCTSVPDIASPYTITQYRTRLRRTASQYPTPIGHSVPPYRTLRRARVGR
eukprot:1265887-Rhodomonas_salina.1